jgi:hypothetical protein
LSKDPVEVLLVVGIEDVTEQEANKSIRSIFAAFRNAEYNELDELCRFDRQHLILENQ